MFNRRKLLALSTSTWFASLFGQAKAESNFSDIVRLREIVIRAAQKQYPELDDIKRDPKDPAKFTVSLSENESTVDISNLFYMLKANPDANLSEEIARFIRVMESLRPFTEDKLILAVRTKEYVEQAESMTGETVSEPLIGDLSIIYMLDQPDSLTTLKKSDTGGKSVEQLHKIAMANLAKWLASVKVEEALSPIYLYTVEGNEMLSPSLILFDEFWEQVEPRVSDDVYFAIPRREQLFLLSAQNADALPALRKLVELTFEDNFNLLSEGIFRRRIGTIETVSN